MGISTIQSYQGSKIFEALGISESVMNEYFPDTVSRVGGIDLDDIAKRSMTTWHGYDRFAYSCIAGCAHRKA